MKPLPKLEKSSVSSRTGLTPLSPVPANRFRRIGFDVEALPKVNWYGAPIHRSVVCLGWGTADDPRYAPAKDRRPGPFSLRNLEHIRSEFMAPDIIVVGHNLLRYDLPVLNGVLLGHGLEPLGSLHVQDTMGNLKTGLAIKNSLKAQCERYGIQLKTGAPDWDKIAAGDKVEWEKMREYNLNDVICALQLERALAADGKPVPVKLWKPTKG